MPTQKDLKRLVRARMQKTGEAYTAARLQLLDDGSIVTFEFMAKGARSAVAVGHEKLPGKAAVEAVKRAWAERFDRLAEFLS